MHKRIILSIIMVALILMPALSGIAARAASARHAEMEALKKIDPALLSDEAYTQATLSSRLDLAGKPVTLVENPYKDKARVTILFTGGPEELREIRNRVYRLVSAWKPGRIGIATAFVDKSQVRELAELPFVLRITHQDFLLDQITPSKPVEAHVARGVEPAVYKSVEYMGATWVWNTTGMGEGVKVAVVDTGVDVGTGDLGNDAIARDENGIPLLFDADELGFSIAFNPTKVSGNQILVEPITMDSYSGVFFAYDGAIYVTNTSYVFLLDLYTGDMYYYEWPVTGEVFTIPVDNVNTSVPINFGLINEVLYYVGGEYYIDFTAPFIVVDSNDADSLYDTVYVDLSSVYYAFMHALANLTGIPEPNASLLDYSFADEPPVHYGSEVIARDFTGDGVYDLSLGALAGAVYDVYGFFGDVYDFDWLSDWEPSSYVVPGLDAYYGSWIGVLYDFYGHGTSCAHVIASRGRVSKNLGYVETPLPGIAPHASIGGAVALWSGDVVTAQLWLSGFDMADPEYFSWVYTGSHKVDVISNSWGSSYLLINGYASDADPTALFEDFITAVTGTVIVHAAGNGGPGWGSMTMPGSASFVITAGASTQTAYRPLYGYLPGSWGQVVSWSDRGPTQFGYPKPDIVNFGAYAWAGTRTLDGLGDGTWTYDLFGGTSEATPMTAGAVALIIQALKSTNTPYDPFLVKAILKNSADNTGYDAFSQGSGQVNVARAVKMILDGDIVAYSHDSAEKVLENFDETMAVLLGMDVPTIHEVFGNAYDTAIYTGALEPGSSATLDLELSSITGQGSGTLTLRPVHHVLTSYKPAVSLLDTSSAYMYYHGSYYEASQFMQVAGDTVLINLSALPAVGSRILVPLKPGAIQGDFEEISMVFPVEFFDLEPRNDSLTQPMLYYFGVEIHVWVDLNGDGVPQLGETGRVQFDIRQGNAFHVQLGNPVDAMKKALAEMSKATGIPVENLSSMARWLLDIRPIYNFWSGAPIPPMPAKLYAKSYSLEPWDWITVPETVSVEGQATVEVSVNVPEGTMPGVYEGFIEVSREDGSITMVPVSIPVALVIDASLTGFKALAGASQPYPYDNYKYRGALDNTWRPEIGDWRTYPVIIDNTAGRAAAIGVEIAWNDEFSEYDAGLIGPGINFWGVGDFDYLAYVDSAVLGAKMTYPSNRISGHDIVFGYFDYPEPGKAMFYAPLDTMSRATYWLVVHQTIHGGHAAEEGVVIRFRLQYLVINTVHSISGFETRARLILKTSDPSVSLMLYPEEAIVISLLPIQTTPPSITTDSQAGPGYIVPFNVYINATEASTGPYLVLEPVVLMEPTIILGAGLPIDEGGSMLLLMFQGASTYIVYTVVVHPNPLE